MSLACLAGSLFVSVPRTTQAGTPTPRILHESVVFQYPHTDPYDRQNHYGFNHAPSVVTLPDGRLLVAWFSGPFEASVHQVILGAYSDDGGVSWSSAEVVHDAPRRSDFDPAFIADGNRVWLFFTVGRWDRYPFVGLRDVEKVEVGTQSYKLFGRYTEDSGRTWSPTKRVFDGVAWGSRSNGIKLQTDELILPLYQFTSPTVTALRSADGGKSWKKTGEVALPKKIGAGEPTIAQLPSGNLLMVLRTRDGSLWSTRSDDRGTTWSQPAKTEMTAAASSHNLISTESGLVVLTHNPSQPPQRTPLTMRVSNDEGATWGEPLVLAKVTPTVKGEAVFARSVCYPSVTQLQDDIVVAVWTQIEMDATRQSGIIHAARLQLR